MRRMKFGQINRINKKFKIIIQKQDEGKVRKYYSSLERAKDAGRRYQEEGYEILYIGEKDVMGK